MNTRTFHVRARVAPALPRPPAKDVSGGFSFGAFDAASAYAREHMPSYHPIPGGQQVSIGRHRFDAVDHKSQLGAVIYVDEVL